MTEKKLNLLQFATGQVAQAGASPPQIARSKQLCQPPGERHAPGGGPGPAARKAISICDPARHREALPLHRPCRAARHPANRDRRSAHSRRRVRDHRQRGWSAGSGIPDGLVSGRRSARRVPPPRAADREPDLAVLVELLHKPARSFYPPRTALPGLPALRGRYGFSTNSRAQPTRSGRPSPPSQGFRSQAALHGLCALCSRIRSASCGPGDPPLSNGYSGSG